MVIKNVLMCTKTNTAVVLGFLLGGDVKRVFGSTVELPSENYRAINVDFQTNNSYFAL